jgi:hypothetical protein
MAVEPNPDIMADEGRALLTEREREILAGDADVTDNYRYKVESQVRNRIRKHLGGDIDFLAEHFEDGYEIAVDEVCNQDESGDSDE